MAEYHCRKCGTVTPSRYLGHDCAFACIDDSEGTVDDGPAYVMTPHGVSVMTADDGNSRYWDSMRKMWIYRLK